MFQQKAFPVGSSHDRYVIISILVLVDFIIWLVEIKYISSSTSFSSLVNENLASSSIPTTFLFECLLFYIFWHNDAIIRTAKQWNILKIVFCSIFFYYYYLFALGFYFYFYFIFRDLKSIVNRFFICLQMQIWAKYYIGNVFSL